MNLDDLQRQLLSAILEASVPDADPETAAAAEDRALGMLGAAPFPTGNALRAARSLLPLGPALAGEATWARQAAATRIPVVSQYVAGLRAVVIACYFADRAGD